MTASDLSLAPLGAFAGRYFPCRQVRFIFGRGLIGAARIPDLAGHTWVHTHEYEIKSRVRRWSGLEVRLVHEREQKKNDQNDFLLAGLDGWHHRVGLVRTRVYDPLSDVGVVMPNPYTRRVRAPLSSPSVRVVSV